jgi:hypothetical protein
MPRKKSDPVGPPAEQRPTRELYRFIRFYTEKIRAASKTEMVGVFRLIQNVIDKGLGVDEIAAALENYEQDEWRRANPRFSKSIRSFFTVENIKEWQTPKGKPKKVDPLARLNSFAPDLRPAPAVPQPLDDLLSEEEAL